MAERVSNRWVSARRCRHASRFHPLRHCLRRMTTLSLCRVMRRASTRQARPSPSLNMSRTQIIVLEELKQAAHARSLEKKQARADDARHKIIAGALALDHFAKNP